MPLFTQAEVPGALGEDPHTVAKKSPYRHSSQCVVNSLKFLLSFVGNSSFLFPKVMYGDLLCMRGQSRIVTVI